MMELPTKVDYILTELNKAGYEAYVVGGCVRDLVMGRTPHDYDICTAAEPEDTFSIFDNKGYEVIPTGIQHGTVSIVIDGEVFEITTFRIDGEYEDRRHPNSVEFTTDIVKDLSRRDFTINAMAYAPNTGLIDPFCGLQDIFNKRLQTVGNPNDRFAEDALRVLRALRFQSVFGFDFSATTCISILENAESLLKISKERINAELNKMFEGEFLYKVIPFLDWELRYIIPEFTDMVGFNQHNPYHDYDVWQHTINVVKYCPRDRIVRLAALFHDIGKPFSYQEEEVNGITRYHFKGHAEKSAEMTEKILKRLKFSNEDVEDILILIKNHDVTFAPTKKFVRKMLMRLNGEDNFKRLISLRVADILGQKEIPMKDDRLERVARTVSLLNNFNIEEECFSLKKLAINGNDLKELGIKPGPNMGKILNTLLNKVMEENIENTKESLVEFLNKTERSFS